MTIKRLEVLGTCVGCAFYKPMAYPTGQCRRKAPFTSFVKGDNPGMKMIWPLVRDTDWCGEHAVIEGEKSDD